MGGSWLSRQAFSGKSGADISTGAGLGSMALGALTKFHPAGAFAGGILGALFGGLFGKDKDNDLKDSMDDLNDSVRDNTAALRESLDARIIHAPPQYVLPVPATQGGALQYNSDTGGGTPLVMYVGTDGETLKRGIVDFLGKQYGMQVRTTGARSRTYG